MVNREGIHIDSSYKVCLCTFELALRARRQHNKRFLGGFLGKTGVKMTSTKIVDHNINVATLENSGDLSELTVIFIILGA